MASLGWYNGFSPYQREKNFAVLKASVADRVIPAAEGPCRLCGDEHPILDRRTGVGFEYHSEDYSLPLVTTEPALLALCIHCHRAKLHKRFSDPFAWKAFLAHVRRGGFARDLKNAHIAKEVRAAKIVLMRGGTPSLTRLRHHTNAEHFSWFVSLSTDPRRLIGHA